MKKLFAIVAIFGMLMLGMNSTVLADKTPGDDTAKTETVDTNGAETVADTTAVAQETETTEATGETENANQEKGLHQLLKEKFIEGGAFFMSFVLIALILGLALSIERIIYLNLATTNTKKLIANVEEALETGGVEAAKEVCRNTRGPVASIFYQGLDRADQGIEIVEKSVISYGSVQMGLLEKGLTWISLFISIAPMLGFMGTVIGMIDAFDKIQAAGDVNAGLIAGSIKIALITTVSGLVVAMILQVFYNYIVSKVDAIVNSMEDASISLIDILVKYEQK